MVQQLQLDTAFGPVDTWTDGAGPPLVFLHGDTGRGEWSPFLAALALTHQVFVPSMPGYDECPRLEWLRDVAQLASVMAAYLCALDTTPVALIGRGLGAWVAAEMLAAGSAHVGAAVLVNPVGLRPTSGVIVDQFLISSGDWARLSFATDEAYVAHFGEVPAEAVVDQWELNREMTTRIAWRPYLHNLALPHLLAAVQQRTLVVSGTSDRIVAPSVAERYAQLLPDAKHERLNGGHFLDYEQPGALAAIASDFLLMRSSE